MAAPQETCELDTYCSVKLEMPRFTGSRLLLARWVYFAGHRGVLLTTKKLSFPESNGLHVALGGGLGIRCERYVHRSVTSRIPRNCSIFRTEVAPETAANPVGYNPALGHLPIAAHD